MSLVKNDQNNVTYIEGMTLLEYCKFISNSQLIPKNYQGKPADIFLAINMGSGLGLTHYQSLRGISVINGVASIWGDAAMALVQVHPKFEDIKEYFDEKQQAAVCIIKRKSQSQHIIVYSIEAAKKAGLWNKSGPWQTNPHRMLQMRARGFALRDRFADALGGLILAEEAQDYPIDVTPKTRDLNSRLDNLLSNQVIDNSSIDDTISEAKSEPLKESNVDSMAYEDLATLIERYNISEELQRKWCEKAKVENITQLNRDQLKKCIELIQTKYSNENMAYGVEIIDIERINER